MEGEAKGYSVLYRLRKRRRRGKGRGRERRYSVES